MAPTGDKIGIWNRALFRVGENTLIEEDSDPTPASEACDLVWDDILREALEYADWPWARKEVTLTNVDTESVSHTGVGTKTEFDLGGIGYADSSQITVTLAGVEQTEGTDYTVDGDTVTFTSSPSGAILFTVAHARNGWDNLYQAPGDMITPLALMYEDIRSENSLARTKTEYAAVQNDSEDGFFIACNLGTSDFVKLEYIGAGTSISIMPRKFVSALVYLLAAELAESLRKDQKIAVANKQLYMVAISDAWAYSMNRDELNVEVETPTLAARD